MAHISKTFRIFVSSTFSDLKAERNALQEHVFPKLRELCTKHGCRFQAIDLRWGVSDEAGLDQRTMQICLKEIARCQNVTPRPNFIVLLGDRYGWHPLPAEIDANEFEEILQKVPKQVLDLLLWNDDQPHHKRGWYRRDDNAIPPVYCLRPREVNIPDNANDEERDEAFERERKEWTVIERKLRTTFLEAINKLGWSDNDPRRSKYEASATHQEIVDGAMKTEDADEHVFGYFRSIKNLDTLRGRILSKTEKNFVDTDSKGGFDDSSHQKLLDMKTDLTHKLGENIHEYEATWMSPVIPEKETDKFYDSLIEAISQELSELIKKKEGIDKLDAEDWDQLFKFKENYLREHNIYYGSISNVEPVEHHISYDHIPSLCADVFLNLVRIILTEIAKFAAVDELEAEIVEHLKFGEERRRFFTGRVDILTKIGEERRRFFTGRVDILTKIEEYLKSDDNHPLAIHGVSGSGKSALMAEASARAQKKHPKTENVVRFIGVTPDSSNGRSLLESLCQQLSDKYNANKSNIPSEYSDLSLDFQKRLRFATKEHSLIIFLDALDQLSAVDNARMLYWLPKELPANVQIVVSTLPGECLNALEKKLPKGNIIKLELMEPDEGERLLDKWLDDAKRKLQKRQRGEVLNKFKHCRLPLYLKLAFEEARLWRSFDKRPDLGRNTPEIIKNLFDRLSDPANHGKKLVSHALSYLQCARHGLTEDEMLDLLARDKEYLDDFLTHIRHDLPKTNGERHLPVVIWSRLYHDLERYLTWRAGDNTSLLAFFHRQFGEVVDEKYLNEEKKTNFHTKIADYFFSQNHNLVDDEGKKIPNHRKMSELPYQQSYGKDWENLETTLTDLYFIETKCTAGKTYDLVSDYNRLGVGRAQLGPIIKTAWKHKGRLGIWCPHCLAGFQIDESQLGKVINCPECESKLKINQFTIKAKWQIKPAQRKVQKRERIENHQLSPDVGEFADFIRDQINFLLIYPKLTFQQAANQSDILATAKFAYKLWKSGIERRPWVRWINKPQHIGCCIATLSRHYSVVNACAYSPDGSRIVSASYDKTLKIWDADHGKLLNTLTGAFSEIHDCAYSPDGRHITSTSGQKLQVYDAESGEELTTLSGHSDWVNACAYSPDGNRIVSASSDRTLRIWDAKSGKELALLSGHSARVTDCAYSPDGRRIVSASWDDTLKIWDAESGDELNTLSGHKHFVVGCAYSPDGNRIISLSWEEDTIKIWDAESGVEIATMSECGVSACAYSPDGSHIISAFDETIKIWDAESGVEINTLTRHSGGVSTFAYSPDGNRIVSTTGSFSGCLYIWDAKIGEENNTLTEHSDYVKAYDYSPDGNRVVSASWKGPLRIWDAESGEELHTLSGHKDEVESCAYSPDGSRIISASGDKTLKIWDAESGKELATLSGHWLWVNACAYSPDGSRIVSASGDKTLKIWNAESGEELHTLSGHRGFVESCAYSPDGYHIISAARDYNLKIWDAESGEELNTLFHLEVAACSYSPDGSRIVSASSDKLKIWDAKSGKELITLFGYSGGGSACVYSPDKRRIISTIGGMLTIWDVESGEEILSFPTNAATSFSFSKFGSIGKKVVALDYAGCLCSLQLENLPIGPPILTPWHSSDDDTYAFGCAFCRKWSIIQQSDLGTELDCPKCGNKVKLNPFTINADWRTIAKAWGDENYK